MTFERLVWHGLVQGRLRLFMSVVSAAVVCALSILATSDAPSDARARYALLLLAPVVFVSCWVGANQRKARDRILFRFGFSPEQLATLLGLEGLAIGALGAALGISFSVAAWAATGGAGHAFATADFPPHIAPGELSFTFCTALFVSALAALGPAYRLARTNFEDAS